MLVCRVGRRPVVEAIETRGPRGGITAMQAIVGGFIECVTLDDGVDVWCNEDALSLGLPLNRIVPAAPRPAPTLFGEPVDIIYEDDDLARPGEPGEWRFHGDFFMARTDRAGELADIDDASVERYTKMFDAEDTVAAHRMNELRVRGERP